METPPGFIFLCQIIPRLLPFPAAFYLANKLLFGDAIPKWVQVLACFVAFPAIVYFNGLVVQYHHRREAKLRGAVLAPVVPYRWPGAIDTLVELLDNYMHGYVGEPQMKMLLAHGNTVCTRILFEDKLLTAEPDHIKSILVTQFSTFMKGAILKDHLQSLLGTGVFNSDGDVWKFHRSMTRPFFSKDRISDFDIFEKHTEDAIDQLRARLREGYPVDFQDVVSRFTLDSATEFLLGKDVCSLSAGLVYPPSSPLSNDPAIIHHPANHFAHAFHEAQLWSTSRGFCGTFWRAREFWEDKVRKNIKVCHDFIDPILKEALEKKNKLKNSGISTNGPQITEAQEGDTLLDHLVKVSDDHTLIRDETLNILLAGRDTTATTLTFIVYMLSQHPEVMRRLREEVLSTVGSSKRPTLDNMREMKYVRAVINETLRLYPPVPFNVRTSCRPVVWPGVKGSDPIFVPANTPVIFSVFLMHRRKDLWGPDALEFDPDRFLDERLQKYLTPNPYIFLPFIVGPRLCPGQQFAYNETSFFLVRLLQAFSSVSLDLETQTLPPAEWASEPGRKGVDKVLFKSHLTAFVVNGLWVKMEEAATV